VSAEPDRANAELLILRLQALLLLAQTLHLHALDDRVCLLGLLARFLQLLLLLAPLMLALLLLFPLSLFLLSAHKAQNESEPPPPTHRFSELAAKLGLFQLRLLDAASQLADLAQLLQLGHQRLRHRKRSS